MPNAPNPIDKPAESPRNRHPRWSSFPIVCIGLSAGGLAPLEKLFCSLSATTGMAFIIIHHLRKGPTHLPDILGRYTAMPVQLASPGLMARPNHVYVLPAGQEMRLADGYFLLRPRSKVYGFANVITIFLNSLSQSQHPRVAVILSGLDADGAAAFAEFVQQGGIAIVQAPESALHPQMPMSAIHTGRVDYILVPAAIAKRLELLAQGRQHDRRPPF